MIKWPQFLLCVCVCGGDPVKVGIGVDGIRTLPFCGGLILQAGFSCRGVGIPD